MGEADRPHGIDRPCPLSSRAVAFDAFMGSGRPYRPAVKLGRNFTENDVSEHRVKLSGKNSADEERQLPPTANG
jgi:hypothetical protein